MSTEAAIFYLVLGVLALVGVCYVAAILRKIGNVLAHTSRELISHHRSFGVRSRPRLLICVIVYGLVQWT